MASRGGVGSRGGSASAIGMMEGAFFVSRTELITWVNDLLMINISKVEQCASGAIYCQIIDSCKQGSVSMKKVNWMAKSDHEFIPNYKVLQAAFDKNQIEKHIPVDMLIRAKYQDNLEMLQWMKCHWEREVSQDNLDDYDPSMAREGKPMPPWAKAVGSGGPAVPRAVAAASRAPPPRQGLAPPREKENLRPQTATSDASVKRVPPPPRAASKGSREVTAKPVLNERGYPPQAAAPRARDNGVDDSSALVADLQAKVDSHAAEMADIHVTLDGLERERDYYFRKLRDAEIMCTTLQEGMGPDTTRESIIGDVLGILYAENGDEDEDVHGGGDAETDPAWK